MGKVKQTVNKCFEDSEAFIKRLSDSDDNFSDDIYEGYVTELSTNLMTHSEANRLLLSLIHI